MLRGLYRFYLYTVFIAMLIFAAIGIGGLLQTVLSQTFFKDPSSTISTASMVQSIVFAAVALLTAAIFGGLHYWLIRRDMHNDPSSCNGAVRAFFLNAVEFVTLPLAVGSGGFTVVSLGQQYTGGASFGMSFSISLLALWLVIEVERRRVPASSGVAIVFQRLHFYGTQLILLFILTSIWISGVGLLIDALFFGGRGLGIAVCGGFTVCSGPNLLSQIAGILLVLAFWLGYSWLSRHDTPSLLRKIFHFISFGYGVIALLIGIYRGVSLLLFPILKITMEQRSLSGFSAPYDVVSPLTLGLLVAGLYTYWLLRAARQGEAATEQVSATLTIQSIATALMGATFWYGVGYLLLNLLERVFPSATAITPEHWANGIALVVTGLAYIPLDLRLRQRSERTAFTAPLRGFVFALFGGGIVTSAIGGAIALYAYSTALLGSPLDNWQYIAHSGLAALVVGIAVVGLYLWVGMREHVFTSPAKQSTSAATVATPITSAPPDTSTDTVPTIEVSSPIAAILDELLIGKITRDEAIARIEGLVRQHA